MSEGFKFNWEPLRIQEGEALWLGERRVFAVIQSTQEANRWPWQVHALDGITSGMTPRPARSLEDGKRLAESLLDGILLHYGLLDTGGEFVRIGKYEAESGWREWVNESGFWDYDPDAPAVAAAGVDLGGGTEDSQIFVTAGGDTQTSGTVVMPVWHHQHGWVGDASKRRLAAEMENVRKQDELLKSGCKTMKDALEEYEDSDADIDVENIRERARSALNNENFYQRARELIDGNIVGQGIVPNSITVLPEGFEAETDPVLESGDRATKVAFIDAATGNRTVVEDVEKVWPAIEFIENADDLEFSEDESEEREYFRPRYYVVRVGTVQESLASICAMLINLNAEIDNLKYYKK